MGVRVCLSSGVWKLGGLETNGIFDVGDDGLLAKHGLLGRASALRSDAIGSQGELRCGAIRKTSHPSEKRPSFVRVKRMGHPALFVTAVMRPENLNPRYFFMNSMSRFMEMSSPTIPGYLVMPKSER
jgi:hypothetical protein